VEQGRLFAARKAREAKAKEVIQEALASATGPEMDLEAIKKDIEGLPAARPESGAHEAGFAFDSNFNRLSSADQKKVRAILNKAGFFQLKGDAPHFRAFPSEHGYRGGLKEAIQENQWDLNRKLSGVPEENWMEDDN